MDVYRFVADVRWLDVVGDVVPVVLTDRRDDFSYFRAIDERMKGSRDGLVVVEQDILVDDQMVDHFVRSLGEERVLVYPYMIYPVSTALDRPVYAHRVVTQSNGKNLLSARWIDRSDKVCDLYGFGFTYISKDLWNSCSPFINKGWKFLDYFFSVRTWQLGVKVKILWDYEPRHLHI
jgi:hypothetical protein